MARYQRRSSAFAGLRRFGFTFSLEVQFSLGLSQFRLHCLGCSTSLSLPRPKLSLMLALSAINNSTRLHVYVCKTRMRRQQVSRVYNHGLYLSEAALCQGSGYLNNNITAFVCAINLAIKPYRDALQDWRFP